MKWRQNPIALEQETPSAKFSTFIECCFRIARTSQRRAGHPPTERRNGKRRNLLSKTPTVEWIDRPFQSIMSTAANGDDVVRVGIIGCGKHVVRSHLFTDIDELRFVGVYDPSTESVRAASKALGRTFLQEWVEEAAL